MPTKFIKEKKKITSIYLDQSQLDMLRLLVTKSNSNNSEETRKWLDSFSKANVQKIISEIANNLFQKWVDYPVGSMAWSSFNKEATVWLHEQGISTLHKTLILSEAYKLHEQNYG